MGCRRAYLNSAKKKSLNMKDVFLVDQTRTLAVFIFEKNTSSKFGFTGSKPFCGSFWLNTWMKGFPPTILFDITE